MKCKSVRPERCSMNGGRRRAASLLSLILFFAGPLFLASATASLLTAQTRASQTNTSETSTGRRTVWDGVYTEAQAARGMMAFGQSCSGCHALAGQGDAAVVGGPFWKR